MPVYEAQPRGGPGNLFEWKLRAYVLLAPMASPTDRAVSGDVTSDDGAPVDEASDGDVTGMAEVAAPNVTAPAVEAAGLAPQAVPIPAAAAAACAGGVQQIVVGYEPGIPLSGGNVETRALRVLERAFPKPCHTLTLRSTRREDIAPDIVKGQIDVGILGVPAAGSHAAPGVTSLPAADTEGVDVVMLQPASYAVVSVKPETTAALTSGYTDVWLFLPLGLLAGFVALAFSTYLLNFRVIRGPAVTPGHTRIDPRLARLGSAVHWMYAETSGRLLSLIWGALGAILIVQLASTENVVHAALQREWQPLKGAELAAYPGRDIYEMRDGLWKKCPRPYKCLHNYEQGVTQALAGDRDVLCRYEAQTHATLFAFMPDVAVPLLYALLVAPAASSPAGGVAIGKAVLEALAREPYAGSPFSACSATAANTTAGQ